MEIEQEQRLVLLFGLGDAVFHRGNFDFPRDHRNVAWNARVDQVVCQLTLESSWNPARFSHAVIDDLLHADLPMYHHHHVTSDSPHKHKVKL